MKMKKITFYRSSICPRCFMARKYLMRLQKENDNCEIEEIDVLTNPLKTWRDGIRMVPALKIEDRILAGLYLSFEDISQFVTNENNL